MARWAAGHIYIYIYVKTFPGIVFLILSVVMLTLPSAPSACLSFTKERMSSTTSGEGEPHASDSSCLLGPSSLLMRLMPLTFLSGPITVVCKGKAFGVTPWLPPAFVSRGPKWRLRWARFVVNSLSFFICIDARRGCSFFGGTSLRHIPGGVGMPL